jgi:hypothetical protein
MPFKNATQVFLLQRQTKVLNKNFTEIMYCSANTVQDWEWNYRKLIFCYWANLLNFFEKKDQAASLSGPIQNQKHTTNN